MAQLLQLNNRMTHQEEKLVQQQQMNVEQEHKLTEQEQKLTEQEENNVELKQRLTDQQQEISELKKLHEAGAALDIRRHTRG